jgi:hypothetical protein
MYKADLDFVKRILKNNKSAWDNFVNKYTNNFFFRAKSWTKKSEYNPLQEKRMYSLDESQSKIAYTDDTVDAYLWIFEQFKNNKLKSYKGFAPLDHYINAVLADKRFMIECIRKIKGRIKIPKCLQSRSEKHKKIFTLMTQNKHEGQIASVLEMTVEKVMDIQNEVRDILRKDGKEDMVVKQVMNEIDENILTAKNKQLINSIEDEIDLKKEINRVIIKLTPDEKLLLKFYFFDKLTPDEIIQSYRDINRNLPDKINPENVDKKDLTGIIDSIIDKIKNILVKKYKELENIKNLNRTLEAVLYKYYSFF